MSWSQHSQRRKTILTIVSGYRSLEMPWFHLLYEQLLEDILKKLYHSQCLALTFSIDQILEVPIIVPKVTNNLKRFNWVNRAWHVSEYIGIGGTTDRERKERGALWKHERIWTSGYHDRISIGPLHPSTKRDRTHEEAGRIKNKRRHVCVLSRFRHDWRTLWDLMDCSPLLHGKTDRDKFASRRKGILQP